MSLAFFQRTAAEDLALLLKACKEGKFPSVAAPLALAFAVARAKEPGWFAPGPVLAISFGGSNSAAGVVEHRGNVLHVRSARRLANPVSPRPTADFLDDLLLGDAEIVSALREGQLAAIGVSLAVPVIRGIPCHPSKLASVIGLVCPSMQDPDPALHFGNTLTAWLKAKGFSTAPMAWEGDAPVAHLGGVACASLRPAERSLLLVVGTGLALANETEFILPSLLKVLCNLDSTIFPPGDCEDGQFQYQIAGKGIFKTLRRAIQAAGLSVDLDWLATPSDSKMVFLLWGNDPARPELQALKSRLGERNFAAVQQVATQVALRGIRALAACAAATLAREGPAPDGLPYRFFFEGSIMRNPAVFAAFRAELSGLLAEPSVFANAGFPVPITPIFSLDADYPPSGSGSSLASTDLTLLGAATLAGVSRHVDGH